MNKQGNSADKTKLGQYRWNSAYSTRPILNQQIMYWPNNKSMDCCFDLKLLDAGQYIHPEIKLSLTIQVKLDQY